MGKYDQVPNRPHLLVVPNPLVEQWTRELKIFFSSKMIEIHTLPTSESAVELYLNEEFRKSTAPDILRVVICSHSVSVSRQFIHAVADMSFQTLANLSGQYFDIKRSIKSKPLDVERNILSTRTNTIFTTDFCLVAIDEIHEFRGSRSRAFIGAVALAKRAAVVVGATATPIVSQPRVSSLI